MVSHSTYKIFEFIASNQTQDIFKRLITSTLFMRVCVRACLTPSTLDTIETLFTPIKPTSREITFFKIFSLMVLFRGERARKSVFVIFFIGIGFALTRFDQVKMSMSHHLMMCFFHLCSFNPPSNIPLNFCLPNDIPLVLSYTYLHNGAAA